MALLRTHIPRNTIFYISQRGPFDIGLTGSWVGRHMKVSRFVWVVGVHTVALHKHKWFGCYTHQDGNAVAIQVMPQILQLHIWGAIAQQKIGLITHQSVYCRWKM